MLKLSRVAPNEWEFVCPDTYSELMEQFHEGCELYEEGNLDEAEKVSRTVFADRPDHADAIHHLALVLSGLSILRVDDHF